MKIAVVGCGALGSFYGAKLARSSRHDVWFLLRSDYQAVRQQGVRIRSRDGDFVAFPHAADAPEAIGVADLVVIGLKTTANDHLPTLVSPLVGSDTAVLTLQNGLGNEEVLARFLPDRQILGGLCFVCLNRLEPGLVQHIDHGRVVLGEFRGPATARTREIAGLFVDAGVPCEVTDDLARAHWEKLTWNIPFNGLGVAGAAGWTAVDAGRLSEGAKLQTCLTTDLLLADSRWHELVRALILEVIWAARKLGYPLEDSLVETQIRRTLTMGAYKPSTVIDFERGLPLELESLFAEPLRRAQTAGEPAPRLEKLVAVLRQMQEG